MIADEADYQPGFSWADHAMAAECAEIGREWPGWTVTWTSMQGFRAQRGDDVRRGSSRTALRCLLALAEFQIAW